MSQNTIKTWQERITAAKEVDPKFNFDAVKAESIGAEIRELRARVSELEAIAVNLTDAAEATHTAVPAALTDDDYTAIYNACAIEADDWAERLAYEPSNIECKGKFMRLIEQHLMSVANNLLASGQGAKDSERLDAHGGAE